MATLRAMPGRIIRITDAADSLTPKEATRPTASRFRVISSIHIDDSRLIAMKIPLVKKKFIVTCGHRLLTLPPPHSVTPTSSHHHTILLFTRVTLT